MRPSKSVLVPYSPFDLPFDPVQSETRTESKNTGQNETVGAPEFEADLLPA
jgi:hypothetical protein